MGTVPNSNRKIVTRDKLDTLSHVHMIVHFRLSHVHMAVHFLLSHVHMTVHFLLSHVHMTVHFLLSHVHIAVHFPGLVQAVQLKWWQS